MGRAVYPHELVDPDFSWLISRYQENHPRCLSVESTTLPMVLIQVEESEGAQILATATSSDELPVKAIPDDVP